MKPINFHPKTLTAKSVLWAKSLFHAVTGSDAEWHSQSGNFTHTLEQDAAGRVEKIRSAMLCCVGAGSSPQHERLERRLRWALDAQALWYLRSDLMAVLSDASDEREARVQVQNITAMFRGLVSESMFGRNARMH